MAQISIIKYSDIVKAKRFDAEYFKPFNLRSETLIKNNKYQYLHELGNFVVGPFGSTVTVKDYVKKSDYKYIRGKDIKNGFISDIDNAYIPKHIYDALPQFHVKDGDIFITVVGTLGNIGLYRQEFGPAIFSCKSTIFRANNINKEFISVFLMTKYGRALLMRNERGAVQTGFNLPDLKQIPVPILPQSFQLEIEKIVKQAYQNQNSAKELYKEAERLLLEELGLVDYKPEHKLTFTATKKQVAEAKRFDAEYFQPKYAEIIKKIENYKTILLADKHYFEITTGTYISSYSNIGTPYIRSVDINNNLTINFENIYRTEEKVNNKFKVKIGDIITSRVGSIGTLGYITEELENSIISDNILRIRNYHTRINNLFLALYLKKIGKIFMERLSRGSVQQRLNQETLKEIKIPLIDPQVQNQIAEKIRESHHLHQEAKALLEKAKKMVEEEIEKQAAGTN